MVLSGGQTKSNHSTFIYPTSETMLRNGAENESQTTVRPTMPVITAQHEPADTTTGHNSPAGHALWHSSSTQNTHIYAGHVLWHSSSSKITKTNT